MEKVLIITYYWPPSGGAGVQRWLKFSKYLPEFGWEPVVLTVHPHYAAYSVTDPSLEKEVSGEIKVYRTKATDWYRLYNSDKSKVPSAGFANNRDDTLKGRVSRFIRGNFFIPDPRRGWNRHAFKKACELIKKKNINHVVTTSPPHSTQLVGLKLKKRFPYLKWFADMRDPWTGIYYYRLFYPTFITRTIDSFYEKNVIRNADAIITVGKSLAAMIKSINRNNDEKIHVITNGFDEEDFREVKNITPERFTVTYVGTLSDAYPVDAFISALAKIKRQGLDFLLRFVGSVNNNIKIKIENSLNPTNFEFIPYTSHKEAIRYMVSSSVLLLIIPVHLNNNAIITGKLFEYIAAGKQVLFIGPAEGDAADYLKQCGNTGLFSGQDPEKIEKFILKTMRSEETQLLEQHPEYSRRLLTLKLADILALG
jgi:glycosyltransferase involved in cell wall biosynthesis